MKRIITLLLSLLFLTAIHAQNEVELRTDGLVVPRTTTGAVSSPTEGMIIYDTSIDNYQYYNGSAWSEVDGGAFEKSGDVVRQRTSNYNIDDFVFGRGDLPTSGSNSGSFFFFDQTKSAFRGGVLFNSPNWNKDSLGIYSFGYGYNVKASGYNGAAALGFDTKASGNNGATALGYYTEASGYQGATALGSFTEASGEGGATALGYYTNATGDDGATALGSTTKASGDNGATALGYETVASGNSCTVVGTSNDIIVAAKTPISPTSPLFIVGNGESRFAPSNALVVRKDGNIGVNNNADAGQFSIKQKTSNDASGLRLISNSDNAAWVLRYTGFNGNLRIKALDANGAQVSFGDFERIGGAYIVGSDRRLKKNINYMDGILDQILSIQPATYNWKKQSDDSQKSMGVIAQELEVLFPSSVSTNEDGYKMVNYDALGILAIQGIKEQHILISEQGQEIDDLKELVHSLLDRMNEQIPLQNIEE